MRKALLVPSVAALVLAVAAPASAGPADSTWSPWKPIPSKPSSIAACGTTVALTFPVNQEEQRTRPLPAGATAIEVRGPYTVTFTPKDHPERAVTKDASGESISPNYSIAYKNGDFLYRATGNNVFFNRPTEIASSKLPQLAVTYGPVAILFSGSAKGPQADVITRPGAYNDICKALAG